MRPDLYQAETDRIATQQGALLRQAKDILAQGRTLTLLEQGGVLHALQVLIENAIGKAKQALKACGQTVPVSATMLLPIWPVRGCYPRKTLQPGIRQWGFAIASCTTT
jgi:hypothetical protein